MNKKNEPTSWKEIIITAVLTSALTLGCSYFIMKSQLTEEQKYWLERFRTERAQIILNKKVQLLEQLNEGILESEVLAKELKLSFSSFHARMELSRVDPDCNLDDIHLEKKIVDYHKHISRLAAKFQMVPVYFPNNVANLVEPLNRAIELNYKDNEKTLIQFSTSDPKQTEDYFKRNFDTVRELTEARKILIKKMLEDINTFASEIYAPNKANPADVKSSAAD